jgi:8-oxo-dGTP pyrophosphatase MutT (NUDIX family)
VPDRVPDGVPEGAAAVRDAATLILVRREAGVAQVLMGQRGAAAVFMPGKFVFPGGAVDPGDLELAGCSGPADEATRRRLAAGAGPELARALPLAAVRELWEETGLRLGRPDPAAASREVPAAWRGFFEAGLVPDASSLRLVFRAVTPAGRPRRFDARFFLADAEALPPGEETHAGDGELGFVQWLGIPQARRLPLPFITEVVLSELEALLSAGPGANCPVPFFDHDAEGSHFRLL